MPTPPPGLIWIEDTDAGPGIATRLGVKPGTIRRWRCTGRGPAMFRLHGRVTARVDAVDRYLAEAERSATQPRTA